MTEDRPDPDALLQVVGDDPHRPRRGQLKIFFGACAGVGKTYAMLQAAHQLRAEGMAVAIGIVETHGREETLALTQGLPMLPRKEVRVNGRLATEFDLDGALTAGYPLLVVDELAHSNLPGSRHAKRWQDVEELLDAGIDVYTALNVQHLDSLNDVVGGIVGIRVRETVPDRIFDRAADVVLVDLPPDDLLARLNAGKVYLPPSAMQARQHFFRRGNLIALRELALRRVADRVNADVRVYRISHAIRTVWPTRELLMVCVSADSAQEALIREGARLALQLQTPWVVLHVDPPHESGDIKAQEALLHLAACAQHAGAD
ncbi:MAG: two-component system sensor histidine kinase KdbD, partial [Microvirgula sp.]